jgi:hypothetical protein
MIMQSQFNNYLDVVVHFELRKLMSVFGFPNK